MNLQKEKQAFDYDLTYLSDIAGGSNEFMVDMLDIFLTQTPVYFNQLEVALADKNWLAVANIAHKIKPALDMMGLRSAKDHIATIETNARKRENLGQIETDFNSLKAISGDIFKGLDEIKQVLCKK